MTKRIPSSTYRLQLHEGFTFTQAAEIAPYLSELGVSHVYSSPYLQAAPKSMHGYDVVDHQRVNEELGGWPGHARFSKILGENGLGQILDIVPNHMSLGKENRLWWDVLENGELSRFASFFDIDWRPNEERLRNKVLVPILGEQYGRALQSGGVVVVRSGSTFHVEASGQTFPVAPSSLPVILHRAAEYAKSDVLAFLASSFGRLPQPEFWDRHLMRDRNRDKTVLFQLLTRLCQEESQVCEKIDQVIRELNSNLDALDDFLNQQHYRLAFWKTADQQLGYRRFFDVNTLIGIRMERDFVFEEAHCKLVEWLHEGVLDGVRVDHPDGLRDPLQYFRRLREHMPEGWIIGEKILEAGEFLRPEWPIDGTSGYDFMNVAMAVLLEPAGMEKLTGVYADFIGKTTSFPVIAHDEKQLVMQSALGSDVNRLTSLLVQICETNRNQRDFTRVDMNRAIREIAACFAIYRTYVQPERDEITDEDRHYIDRATQCAKENRADIDPVLFDFLHDLLTLKVRGKLEDEFVLRFQQFGSPVMAKGVEDTAFYNYNRLVATCEVGGEPSRNGMSVDEFHSYSQTMQSTHPLTMTTLSTHDSKRSDDVRARLFVLSEIPSEFADAVTRWSVMNAEHNREGLVDRNTEYFLYQTLIGVWPITEDRLQQYMQKATREAKDQTSWTENNKPFEDALTGFITALLASQQFTRDLESFVAGITPAAQSNSLAQTLLKNIGPGVPDLYQGSELWDFSLVDPDNRRPVDYTLRRRLLGEVKGLTPAAIVARADEGLTKLWTLTTSLQLRREHPQWFREEAAYTPILASGSRAAHVIAFGRGEHVITVVPRAPHTLAGRWDSTTLDLPTGPWINRLTGESFPGGRTTLSTLLANFPVALLVKETPKHA